MTSTKRNLILFQPPDFSNEIYHELSMTQWDVYLAHDIQQASDLCGKHNFPVGLCLIDNWDNASQLKRLFNGSESINWIMGLPSENKAEMPLSSTHRELLADHSIFGHLTIPVDKERLFFALGYAYGMHEVSNHLQNQIDDSSFSLGIIGNSPPMQKLFLQLKKVCNEDCTVLITGETGTGKELIANAIHKHSARSVKPLIAVNCSAFPKDLIQAELFGYEKGAFSGAQQRKIGLIESAQGGTLFLDEAGDLPYEQQGNLLRFLEERKIRRVGGSEKIPVNVRIIAATHVELKKAVQNGAFREDLYYRLRVLQIETPPLRARENDIELLAVYFFKKFSKSKSYKAKGFSTDALYLLNNYDWPGNVRELMNCICQAVVMSENRLLTPADLGLEKRLRDRTLQTLEEARALAECESISTCLQHTNYNMTRAAEMLGITRVSLYRLVEKYKLKT